MRENNHKKPTRCSQPWRDYTSFGYSLFLVSATEKPETLPSRLICRSSSRKSIAFKELILGAWDLACRNFLQFYDFTGSSWILSWVYRWSKLNSVPSQEVFMWNWDWLIPVRLRNVWPRHSDLLVSETKKPSKAVPLWKTCHSNLRKVSIFRSGYRVQEIATRKRCEQTEHHNTWNLKAMWRIDSMWFSFAVDLIFSYGYPRSSMKVPSEVVFM